MNFLIMNSTKVSHFRLTAYFDSGPLRYFYFFLLLFVYVLIVCSNLLLIVVICLNRSLHEPMYLLLCSLFVNELYGSTGLFPLMLVQVLSDSHTVPAPLCFLQVFWMYCYGGVEYLSLAVMSYDRYLAICCPLHYNSRVTSRKIVVLVAVTWLYPLATVGAIVCATASLQLCGDTIHKVYCHNSSIISLSCSDTTVFNIVELFGVFVMICVPSAVIFYTYAMILKVCFRGSKETRQKAVSTCTPQLASIVNFTFGAGLETVQIRFNMSSVPAVARIFLSTYWLTCQPLLNPVMYGLNMAKIRLVCKKLLFA